MMSTDEILKVIDSNQTSQLEETDNSEESVKETVDPETVTTDTTDAVEETEAVPEKPVKEESKDQVRFSHKEKSDHAFAKLKAKNKAAKERYESRIKELEEELNKYKGLTLDNFSGNQQDYIDYVIGQKDKARELDSLRNEQETLYNKQIDEINDYIVNNTFSTQEEIDEYNKLISDNGKAFHDALQTYDRDNVVLSYLDTLDNYPKLLKILMTDDNALRRVFASNDPFERKMALINLNKEINTVKPNKKPLPVIGRQVNAVNSGNAKRDDNYWNNYIKSHPRGSV